VNRTQTRRECGALTATRFGTTRVNNAMKLTGAAATGTRGDA